MSYTCHTHVIHMSHTCPTHVIHMSYTCHTHVIHMSYTCHTHVKHMSNTRRTHVVHTSYTCHTHVIHMSYTCHTHVQHMSYTCPTHVIHLSNRMSYTSYSVMLGYVRSWMHVGHVVADKHSSMPDLAREFYYVLPSQLGGRPWQADRYGPQRPLWHASRPCLAGTLRRRAGWDVAQANGQRAQAYTWPHVIHLSNRMSNTCQTHVIHMPYTWNTHGVHIVFGHALSRSVILGHGCCWPLGM